MKTLKQKFHGTSRLDAPVVRGLTDNQLLDLVQKQTLRYFWDFGHPVSGMARERSNHGFGYDPDATVTTGGTGFGIMGMIAGAERGFLPRAAVRKRIEKIADFLLNAPNFHGAFPHFMNGHTGKVIGFSGMDNGGDIVETAFLMMGLMTARQYFTGKDAASARLRDKINTLWENVDWNWYTQGKDDLYWHWSPTHKWGMNHPVKGWDECLIAHILAAASPTHPVKPVVYEKGWKQTNRHANGLPYYGFTLPLGPHFGGPLFFTHYSFLGLDPRGLKDRHADYWEQNVNHTRINYTHCVVNPFGHKGYSDKCWGLTSSDSISTRGPGYHGHAPDNDNGTITPTAALSAFPYTPRESMKALRHFYEERGDKIWRDLGFADAFNDNHDWVASSHLAIDQGPIIGMIENYRSGLLWKLFMSCPEVKYGLTKLSFESPHLNPSAARRDAGLGLR
jgi:hypothetical protein